MLIILHHSGSFVTVMTIKIQRDLIWRMRLWSNPFFMTEFSLNTEHSTHTDVEHAATVHLNMSKISISNIFMNKTPII